MKTAESRPISRKHFADAVLDSFLSNPLALETFRVRLFIALLDICRILFLFSQFLDRLANLFL